MNVVSSLNYVESQLIICGAFRERDFKINIIVILEIIKCSPNACDAGRL
jgi:hypothetical protein